MDTYTLWRNAILTLLAKGQLTPSDVEQRLIRLSYTGPIAKYVRVQ